MLHRAYKISSNEEVFQLEVNRLKQIFSNNNYPMIIIVIILLIIIMVFEQVHLHTWRLRASYIFVHWHDKEHYQQKTRTTLQIWSNQRTFETQTPAKFNFRVPTTKYMSC